MQNEPEKVIYDYTTDYFSLANRDITVTAKGEYVARCVYGADGERISAEYAYADGTNRGESSENIVSDIAAGDEQKVYFRRSLLDSTLFAVDTDGGVIAHIIYDAWGEPQTETKLDANYAGIDNLNNFTGYTHDETLQLYFAQNRFYDAETHKFTQEDPIKDRENWYVYCGNNPANQKDILGFYYIKAEKGANGTDEYLAVQQTWLNAIGRSVLQTVDMTGCLGGILISAGEQTAGYVGGNSLESISASDITKGLINASISTSIEVTLQKVSAKAVPIVSALLSVKDFLIAFAPQFEKVKSDELVFALLKLSNREIRSSNIMDVTRKMGNAFQFIKDFGWYFYGRVWEQAVYVQNVSGGYGLERRYGDTYWEMDRKALNPPWWKSSSGVIKDYRNEYYNVLICHYNTTMMLSPGYTSGTTWANEWADSLKYFLDDYKTRTDVIIDLFKSYIDQ